MYEIDEETGKLGFTHNPFSMPQGGLEALNEKDPLDILAYQYDIVCNGVNYHQEPFVTMTWRSWKKHSISQDMTKKH